MTKWIFGMAFFVSIASASRRVTIPIDSGLKLANTSKTSVTYNLKCKDESGTVIPTFNLTSQNLASGAATTVIKSGSSNSLCGSGWTETTLPGANGMSQCHSSSGNISFATAVTSACAANASMCTIQQIADHRGTATNYMGTFQASGSWSYYNASTWTNYTDGNTTYYGNSKYYGYGSSKFAEGTNGSGTQISDDGWVNPIGSFVYDALCCSIYGTVGQCEVEITSSTGHLSSPQYSGGKSF